MLSSAADLDFSIHMFPLVNEGFCLYLTHKYFVRQIVYICIVPITSVKLLFTSFYTTKQPNYNLNNKLECNILITNCLYLQPFTMYGQPYNQLTT